MARRIGANPPTSLMQLRGDVQASILAATGTPVTTMSVSDGVAKREDYRRFLHSTIAPVARVVADELAVKLDTPGLALNFEALFASDLTGRARAFGSLVKGGMGLPEAAALAGLMMDDDD